MRIVAPILFGFRRQRHRCRQRGFQHYEEEKMRVIANRLQLYIIIQIVCPSFNRTKFIIIYNYSNSSDNNELNKY